MRYLSVCSGAGGFDLGLHAAGHEMVGMIENDPTCRSVLTHHWPAVRLWNDLRRVPSQCAQVELVAGGTPCQDISMAGHRRGLGGERSSIFWDFCRVAAEVPWVAWENVAGVLARRFAADFAAVLWGLTGFHPAVPKNGWSSMGLCAGPERTAVWRVLDARWFGVAQRRRRVFVVAGPPGVCGPALLDLAQGSAGHTRPRPPQGEVVAAITSHSAAARFGVDDNGAQAGHLVAGPLGAGGHGHRQDLDTSGAYVPYVKRSRPHFEGDSPNWCEEQVAPTLTLDSFTDERAPTLLGGELGVRRLTPVECERLMGWPDDHTRWGADGSELSDTARYRMCGNGVVAPVAQWIGQRLEENHD